MDRFFRLASREYPGKARVYLLGGAAAILMGGSRPTLDIDFEADLGKAGQKAWNSFDAAIQKAQEETGILAQYSQSIERWGMITLLDYKRKAQHHKTYGRLQVFVLSPLHWSIGKIGRFLQQDCDDLVQVFLKTRPDPLALAKLWRRALVRSPRSPELGTVQRNILYFSGNTVSEYGAANFLRQRSWRFSPPALDFTALSR